MCSYQRLQKIITSLKKVQNHFYYIYVYVNLSENNVIDTQITTGRARPPLGGRATIKYAFKFMFKPTTIIFTSRIRVFRI